jgi:hypothetical protein
MVDKVILCFVPTYVVHVETETLAILYQTDLLEKWIEFSSSEHGIIETPSFIGYLLSSREENIGIKTFKKMNQSEKN